MPKQKPRLFLIYGIAVSSVAAATLVRSLLDPLIGNEFPFSTLFIAVMCTARYGGFGPAVAATILGALSSAYFLIPPRGSLFIEGTSERFGVGLYLAVSLGLAWLGGAMRTSQRRAEEAVREAVDRQRLLEQENAERRRVEEARRESEETFRLLVEGVRDYAIFMLDPEGRVATWNAGAERIKGYRAEEIIGRFYASPEEMATGKPQEELRTALAEGRLEVEGWRTRKDGSRFWADVIITPLRDQAGRVRGFAKVIRDMTERKQAEEALHRYADELDEANRDLAQKNQENETFVYTVSHDLRSPLVNLQGFSKELGLVCQDLRALLTRGDIPQEVRDRGVAALDGDVAESLQFIQTAVVRLGNIIDALLRMSRVGRVEYQWQWVDVRAVVARVVGSMGGTIDERGAAVTLGDLPPAWGDPTALEQVFANLIGNALNYLDPEREGRIEIGCRPAGDAPAYFVQDNGLGIPEEHRHKVFRAFQRLHPDRAKGEGMGLTIVRRVVERHRGKAWVESRPGEGSTFFVSLPQGPPAEASGRGRQTRPMPRPALPNSRKES